MRVTYLILTAAYLVLFTTLIPLFGDVRFSFGWFVTFSLATLVALPLTHYEWRRNRRTMAMYLIVLVVVPLVSAGGVLVLFDGEHALAAATVLTASLVVLGTASLTLWREFHFSDRIPNELLEHFLQEDNFEDDGVQWVAQCTGHEAATPLEAIVRLQNNIDAERTVSLRFHPETPFAGGKNTLRFAELAPILLPPAASATVTVPFVAAETRPRKQIHVYVHVRAQGPLGPRNRRQRVGAGPRPHARWLVFLALFAGQFLFRRGGVRISLRSSGATSTEVELAPAVVEVHPARESNELFGGALPSALQER